MQAAGDYFTPPFKRWVLRLFTPQAEWNVADQERAAEEMAAHLDVLEPQLAGREYLAGSFSLADVCYAPFVCELTSAGLDRLLPSRPATRAWIERLRARPAIRTTSPWANP